MSKTPKTVGFGAPEGFGAHVFRVEIPVSRHDPVRIIEEYGFEGGDPGVPYEEERVRLSRSVWSSISETARKEFNERLRAKKLNTSRWKTGTNYVDRLLGKELCVLAWAGEKARPEEFTIICSKWLALRPEERWWLFAMTASEAGLPEDSERGWRKALYFALSDSGPGGTVEKRARPLKDHSQLPLLKGGK